MVVKFMQKVNKDDLKWEPAGHEDPNDPGVWKKVIVKHDELDPRSKLMMINLSKVPIGREHVTHSHGSMEEIFYITQGNGEVIVDKKVIKVRSGDRLIIPAKSMHSVRNTGKIELEYIGLGIALN